MGKTYRKERDFNKTKSSTPVKRESRRREDTRSAYESYKKSKDE